MRLLGASDFLHQRSVLEDIECLLLTLPVLGTDDDEVRAVPARDLQGLVIRDDLVDMRAQVVAELVHTDGIRGIRF
jgi:hypothetical protein